MSRTDYIGSSTNPRKRTLLLRWIMVLVALCGFYLRHEELAYGFFADDYAQLGMLDGTYPLHRAPYNLFTFSNGTRAEGELLMHAGFYPWWADPTARIAMFRPLASMMTWLDFKLFANRALFYHLHSTCWWFALLIVVASLYLRWLGPTSALVAFALYVCSDAHGIALAWICNRSAIVSTLLTLLALRLYFQSRETKQPHFYYFALVCYAAALGFGEYAVCALGYFLAYESLQGRGPISRRLFALVPVVGLAVTYLVIRSISGLAIQHSGLYVDPQTEPVAFLAAIAMRLPVLIGDLLFALSADYWTFGFPSIGRALELGWVDKRWLYDLQPWRTLQTALGVFASGCLVALALAIYRRLRATHVPWLLFGAILSLIPVCGSFPSSRLTIVAVFGFAPAIASVLDMAIQSAGPRGSRSIVGIVAAASFVAYHIVWPAAFARAESVRILGFTQQVRASVLQMNVNDESFSKQDLILMTAPEVGTSMYLPLTRKRYGLTAPRGCWYLSLTPSPYTLKRTSRNAFSICFVGQATALETPHEQMLRSASRPLSVGNVVEVGPFRATIFEVLDQRPKCFGIDFDRELEDPSLLFMSFTPHGFQPFRFPPIGGSVTVPELVATNRGTEAQ